VDLRGLQRIDDTCWCVPKRGRMRVPGFLYASEKLVREMDDKVVEQVSNVAALPGIVVGSFAMPDAHWGYGFPIGGVAAFDPNEGGVISAGGVGFDISCGVRTLHTGLAADEVAACRDRLADELFATVPAGVGSRGTIHLDDDAMDAMLAGGARWAIAQGYGRREDAACIEDGGRVDGALAGRVSAEAKRRQRDEMGTLGSGNHYLEVQRVAELFDRELAAAYGLVEGDAVVSIHCGSRGLGHQIGTDYLRVMALAAREQSIELPERELACAPIRSEVGRDYLGAMRAASNCALANRQIITHLARGAFAAVLPTSDLRLLYDVSHNTCKVERHLVDGKERELYVHRKGATRALGPGHPDVPERLREHGQPVFIGGTMGTASYVLAGTRSGMSRSFGSACHGAGRAMSRRQAGKRWHGRDIVRYLAEQGIAIRSPSLRGVAEEAPGAYKDVTEVVEAAERAGLAVRVARLVPIVCVKG